MQVAISANSDIVSHQASNYELNTYSVEQQGVPFGRSGYVLAWTSVLGVHIICAGYLAYAGQVYTSLQTTQVGRILELYKLTLGWKFYPLISSTHYIIASIHLYSVLKPFAAWIVFKIIPTTSMNRLFSTRSRISRRTSSIANSQVGRRISSLTGSRVLVSISQTRGKLSWFIRLATGLFFSSTGLFGIQSVYFEVCSF